MLWKTHMAVGVAATLAVTRPQSVKGLLLAVGGGALGALISDIDVDTSGSHKSADKITLLALVIVAGVILLDYFFHTEIMLKIISDSGYVRVAGGIFLFIGICMFGKEQPHRSFMHSFLALTLLCVAVGLIWEELMPCFAVGFLSHLAIDIFNKRKVRLLYPLKGGVSLNLFYARGVANNVFFLTGSIISAAEILLLVANMFHLGKFLG